MRVLNYGSLYIEKVYTLDDLALPDQPQKAKSYTEKAGGRGLSQSIALARAGADVYHAGKIGLDGLFLKEFLKLNDVDTSLIDITDNVSGQIITQVNDDETASFIYDGTNLDITVNEVEQTLNPFGKDDLLLLQNEISCVAEIIEMAHQKEMRVAFNAAPFTPDLYNLFFDNITWLFVNEHDAKQLFGLHDAEMILELILEKLPNTALVLTQGTKGTYYYFKNSHYFIPAENVAEVDTACAADTLIGFFLAGISRNILTIDSLQLASRAAATCMTKPGKVESIPTLQDVIRKFM